MLSPPILVMASYRKTSHYPISRPIPLICQSVDLTHQSQCDLAQLGFWWFSDRRGAMCPLVKAWSLSLFKGHLSSCSILRLTLSNKEQHQLSYSRKTGGINIYENLFHFLQSVLISYGYLFTKLTEKSVTSQV